MILYDRMVVVVDYGYVWDIDIDFLNPSWWQNVWDLYGDNEISNTYINNSTSNRIIKQKTGKSRFFEWILF